MPPTSFGNKLKGFTYIWVLLTVSVLALGLTKAAEVASQANQRESERVLLALGNEFREAIRSYYEFALVDGSHQYPKTLDQLLLDGRANGMRRHLRKIYVDPMTGRAEWGLVRVGDGIVGVHTLSDKSALKQNGFNERDQQFSGKKMLSEWVFSYPGGSPGPR